MWAIGSSYLRQMRARFDQLRPFLLHLALWLLFIVYEQVTIFVSSGFHFSALIVCLNYLLNVGLFYGNSKVLLPRLGTRHHYILYVLAVLLALSIYSVLRTELTLHLAPHIGKLPDGVVTSYGRFWLLSLYRGAFFAFVSLGYWFARNAIALEREKRTQEHQLRVAEKSLFEANLAFLRSQINPHFLFNSLNFLYAQVYPHSEPAAEGILLLADTMRYALHENGDGKVPLAQEVQHLHNYIALNQLRFNN
jgi:sensor histidine kinase YesM